MVIRHILDHDCIRPDNCIIANNNCTKYLCAGTDIYTVPYSGRLRCALNITVPERDSLPDHAIVSDLGGAMNDDSTEVLDIQSAADSCRRSDIDNKKNLAELAQHDMKNIPDCPERSDSAGQSGMTEPVYQQCPETLRQKTFSMGTKVFHDQR